MFLMFMDIILYVEQMARIAKHSRISDRFVDHWDPWSNLERRDSIVWDIQEWDCSVIYRMLWNYSVLGHSMLPF